MNTFLIEVTIVSWYKHSVLLRYEEGNALIRPCIMKEIE